MRELGVDLGVVAEWFNVESTNPYTLVRVPDEQCNVWSEALGIAIRRCYVGDSELLSGVGRVGTPSVVLVDAKLPDPGSVMSGDFGEILVLLYQASHELNLELMAPMRWRLKQDRLKPAPGSDVVHFHLPSWPDASEDDRIYCAEVKSKATSGSSTPIEDAIADCEKDRTSRLAKTLLWLRDRSLFGDLGTVTTDHLDRFINASEFPPADKRFSAVAVICESLLEKELLSAPLEQSTDYTLVVIGVPSLKQRYEAAFAAARNAVPESGVE